LKTFTVEILFHFLIILKMKGIIGCKLVAGLFKKETSKRDLKISDWKKTTQTMKYLLILFLFSVLSANSVMGQQTPQQKKEEWLDFFKEYATYSCICQITDNKVKRILKEKKDISFSIHVEILGRYKNYADSVGRTFARNIKPVQVDKEDDLYGLKTSFADCLQLLNSKYLDSSSKIAYKKYILSLQ